MTDLSPTDAEKMALADRILAHIGTIAPKCSMPVGEWNDIAEDFYEAADQLYAHPAASQGEMLPTKATPEMVKAAYSKYSSEDIFKIDCGDWLEAVINAALAASPERPAAQPDQGCCMGMAPASQCDCESSPERPAALPMREEIAGTIFKHLVHLRNDPAADLYQEDWRDCCSAADAILSLAPASAKSSDETACGNSSQASQHHNGDLQPVSSEASSDPDAVPDIIAILDEIEVDEDGRCEWTAVANAQRLIKAAHRRTPAVTETEVILDAINDRSPRARQTVDLLLYKFDVYPRPALTEKPSNKEGGK